ARLASSLLVVVARRLSRTPVHPACRSIAPAARSGYLPSPARRPTAPPCPTAVPRHERRPPPRRDPGRPRRPPPPHPGCALSPGPDLRQHLPPRRRPRRDPLRIRALRQPHLGPLRGRA